MLLRKQNLILGVVAMHMKILAGIGNRDEEGEQK